MYLVCLAPAGAGSLWRQFRELHRVLASFGWRRCWHECLSYGLHLGMTIEMESFTHRVPFFLYDLVVTSHTATSQAKQRRVKQSSVSTTPSRKLTGCDTPSQRGCVFIRAVVAHHGICLSFVLRPYRLCTSLLRQTIMHRFSFCWGFRTSTRLGLRTQTRKSKANKRISTSAMEIIAAMQQRNYTYNIHTGSFRPSSEQLYASPCKLSVPSPTRAASAPTRLVRQLLVIRQRRAGLRSRTNANLGLRTQTRRRSATQQRIHWPCNTQRLSKRTIQVLSTSGPLI